jgi:leader peptidase (prepilin peptidase)/N-methyltransferase
MTATLPAWFFNLLSIVIGLVIGSFLNVVVARLPRSESLVSPRSRCPSCLRAIRWHENIPVLSYLALRGRCRGCKNPISVRYPVIELLTALLFLAAQTRFGFGWLLIVRDWPFLAILVAITFIDLEHRLIPNELSLGGLILGLGTGWAVPQLGLISSVGGAALGFGLFYFFAWIYMRASGRSGLGGGDIKLLAMLGAFLGPIGVFTTILISSILGSLIGIAYGAANREGSLLKVSIPYGPFLVIGALYYYLIGDLLWLPFTNPM